MRILLTTDTVGGVWTYALELARQLVMSGHQVGLATMGGPINCRQRRQVNAVSTLRVFESGFKLEWMQDCWQDVTAAGEWLLAVEQCFAPDLVHLNSYVHGALSWKAPCMVVGHSCVLSWWEAVRNESAPAEWDRYRQEVQRGIQAADLVVAPSAAMMDCLTKHYGPIRRQATIHNGRDPSLFIPGMKKQYVFSAGRLWDEAKNIAALAKIADSLTWPVFVAGEQKHPDGSRCTHLREHGLRPLGQLNEQQIANWLAAAPVYVMPARYEPFGLSILEAALSGCALVLGDIPSLREIWQDAALFVAPDNTVSLGETLCMLIGDESLRKRLSGQALERAVHFTSRRMAREYLRLYGRMTPRSAERHRHRGAEPSASPRSPEGRAY